MPALHGARAMERSKDGGAAGTAIQQSSILCQSSDIWSKTGAGRLQATLPAQRLITATRSEAPHTRLFQCKSWEQAQSALCSLITCVWSIANFSCTTFAARWYCSTGRWLRASCLHFSTLRCSGQRVLLLVPRTLYLCEPVSMRGAASTSELKRGIHTGISFRLPGNLPFRRPV